MDPSEQPAEDDQTRIQDVDQAGQPDPEPPPGLHEGPEGGRRPGFGIAQEVVDLGAAAVRRTSRSAQQADRSDLGLPAPDRAAATGQPGRVDRHMADLAPVPGDAGERLALDDQPAADPDLAGHEQDVVGSQRRPTADLREGAEVRLVGQVDRDPAPEDPFESLAEGNVGPTEVRRHRHEAIGPSDDADDGHPDRDLGSAGPSRADDPDELGEIVGDLVRGRMAARPIDPDVVEDLAAQPDDRRGERVDLDVERQDDRALRVGADERRGSTGQPERCGRSLGHQAADDELADQAADRAPGQPGPRHQLRAGERALPMELADDRTQVRPADRFAALADLVASDRHGVCVPLVQMPGSDWYIARAVSRIRALRGRLSARWEARIEP